MTNETTNLVFTYIAKNPKCRLSNISKAVKSTSQLVRYHVDVLVSKGIIVKKDVSGVPVYECALSNTDIEAVLSKTDDIILELYKLVKSTGTQNPKEALTQIFTAYIDLILS